LKSDERESKTWVAAEPELKRNVEGGFRKSIARSTYLARSIRVTRSINISESRVGEESELGGVAEHLVEATFLVFFHGELAPDVHPVTVVTVDALATNFNFNLVDELVSREIKPASVYITTAKILSDFRKSYLKVGSVSKITIAGDGACYTAAEISLTVESLLNGFHSKVSVTSVSSFEKK